MRESINNSLTRAFGQEQGFLESWESGMEMNTWLPFRAGVNLRHLEQRLLPKAGSRSDSYCPEEGQLWSRLSGFKVQLCPWF